MHILSIADKTFKKLDEKCPAGDWTETIRLSVNLVSLPLH